MAKLPSFQFYPGDWLSDAALLRCSLGAQGAWIRMLCLMHQCDERGVLVTDGRPWAVDEIAAAIGGDKQAASLYVTELLEKGVARRSSAGAILSSRMVRDEAIRLERVKAGSLGGRPEKQNESKTKAKHKAKRKQKPEDEDEDEETGVTENGRGAGKPPPEGGDSAPTEPTFTTRRNAIYEALAACFYPSGVPNGKRGLVAAAATEIVKTFNGSVEDVKLRHANIPRSWSGTTPQGLVDHWDDLGPNGTLRSSPPSLFGAASAEAQSPARIKAQPGKYDNLKIIHAGPPPTPVSGNASGSNKDGLGADRSG